MLKCLNFYCTVTKLKHSLKFFRVEPSYGYPHTNFSLRLFHQSICFFDKIVAYQEFLCLITPLVSLSSLNDEEKNEKLKKATGLTSEKKQKPECSMWRTLFDRLFYHHCMTTISIVEPWSEIMAICCFIGIVWNTHREAQSLVCRDQLYKSWC